MPAKTPLAATSTPASPRERVRPWLLAGLVAVCVARPLVPSEGVAWMGDGHGMTLLLLMLTAGYLSLAAYRRSLVRRLTLVDAGVAALVVACVGSSLLGLSRSSAMEFANRIPTPRLAVNMIWEWIGLGLVYFLARQLVASRTEARALVAVMIALAVILSAQGLFQVAVTMPQERAAYAENPDQVLQAVGQWFAAGSPERARFEARLASTEPLATFALTNSLAGFLLAWVVLALGVAWRIWPRKMRAAEIARYVGLVASIGVIVVCLLLTKSRSAYVALAIGSLLLPLVAHDWSRVATRTWWLAAGGGVLVLVLGAAALLIGRDESLLSEATKSLGYRLEYWDATLNMIADFPLFGVGPGEFQFYYTQYKLPQASEEISDPHNFLLEAWATGGIFAMLGLVAVLAAFAWQTWELAEPEEASRDGASAAELDSVRLMLLGAAAGLPLAFFIGSPFGFYLSMEKIASALLIGAVVLGALWVWIRSGTLPIRLPALGVLVLAIHWLASGGFTFPGVAQSFWLLMAVGVNQGAKAAAPARQAPFGWRQVLFPLGVSLPVIFLTLRCYYTAFLPVLACNAAMGLATDARMTDETRIGAMAEAYAADNLSPEPWMASAQLSAQRFVENSKDPELREKWKDRLFRSASSAMVLQSRSSAAAREVGRLLRQAYQAAPSAQLADAVLQSSRTAVHFYPNSAVLQAEYAQALAITGSHDAARRTAARALELDTLTPHADKKLPPKMRSQLEKLAKSPATS
jgi:hypothetical protein